MIVRNSRQQGSTEPGHVSTGSTLREFQKYIERKGLSKTGFSRKAVSDPNFMGRVEKGTATGPSIERARKYMDANP